jgi:putative ABC transport system permease protein
MWRVGVFDLLHRRRRFAVAVLATSLAFAMSLLMAGAVHHLKNETKRVVGQFDADEFVVANGGTGPFTTTRLLLESTAAPIAADPGVKRSNPFIQARDVLKNKDVNVLAVQAGGLGAPVVVHGRQARAPGEAVADSTLGYHLGDVISLGGARSLIVGTSHDTTYYFGQPTVFIPLHDAQTRYLKGLPLVTAVAVKGQVQNLPAGTQAMDVAAVRRDLNRPQKSSQQTVAVLNTLMWLMAAGIVGTMVYLTALERSRDIAVLKAMGASTRVLFGDMAVQGLMLALIACVVGAVIEVFLEPLIPLMIEVPTVAYLQVAIVGVVVGLVAAFVGLRRAVHIDPALAFGR